MTISAFMVQMSAACLNFNIERLQNITKTQTSCMRLWCWEDCALEEKHDQVQDLLRKLLCVLVQLQQRASGTGRSNMTGTCSQNNFSLLQCSGQIILCFLGHAAVLRVWPCWPQKLPPLPVQNTSHRSGVAEMCGCSCNHTNLYGTTVLFNSHWARDLSTSGEKEKKEHPEPARRWHFERASHNVSAFHGMRALVFPSTLKPCYWVQTISISNFFQSHGANKGENHLLELGC